jgi:Skp family chaperone for outer membrane proteins
MIGFDNYTRAFPEAQPATNGQRNLEADFFAGVL